MNTRMKYGKFLTSGLSVCGICTCRRVRQPSITGSSICTRFCLQTASITICLWCGGTNAVEICINTAELLSFEWHSLSCDDDWAAMKQLSLIEPSGWPSLLVRCWGVSSGYRRLVDCQAYSSQGKSERTDYGDRER